MTKTKTRPQPGELAKAVHCAPHHPTVMYLPRWPSDHHPWVEHFNMSGIRYSHQEVERAA